MVLILQNVYTTVLERALMELFTQYCIFWIKTVDSDLHGAHYLWSLNMINYLANVIEILKSGDYATAL